MSQQPTTFSLPKKEDIITLNPNERWNLFQKMIGYCNEATSKTSKPQNIR